MGFYKREREVSFEVLENGRKCLWFALWSGVCWKCQTKIHTEERKKNEKSPVKNLFTLKKVIVFYFVLFLSNS